MSDEETTPDELLRQIVWDRTRATRALRWVAPDYFGRYAAVAAVVDDHDRRHPDAPREGTERILSIVNHAQRLLEERRADPERFSAAASLNAVGRGEPDPLLLALAGQVLTWLPLIVTYTPDELHEPIDRDLYLP